MARRTERKSSLPYRAKLIALANKLDRAVLSDEERLQISQLLRGLAVGRTVDHVIGITPRPGRSQADVFQRVWDVAMLSHPERHWGGGLTVEKAIEQTADAHGLSPHTIKENWDSWEGRAIRDFVRRVMINPLELPLDKAGG